GIPKNSRSQRLCAALAPVPARVSGAGASGDADRRHGKEPKRIRRVLRDVEGGRSWFTCFNRREERVPPVEVRLALGARARPVLCRAQARQRVGTEGRIFVNPLWPGLGLRSR